MANNLNTKFLYYSIFSKTLDCLPKEEKIIINTINQYSYCIAEEDLEFKLALQASDVLLPDGIAIVWSTSFLYQKKIKKIAGADIHEFLLERLNRESGSCFYLGASDTTLLKIQERLQQEYANIKFGAYSPPFKTIFAEADSQLMIEKVNQFKPDVLFVGMTAPKQEKWSFKYKDALSANVICSIGAVFDFYAGTVHRPSKIWIDLGLEWLGRLLKEPKRMWKRYIYYGVVFGFYIVKEKFKVKESKSKSLL